MRFLKSLSVLVPLKLVWLRITSNRWTQAFFIVALAHCLIQLALEAWAFSSNNYAIDRLELILGAGNGQIDQDSLGLAVWQEGRLTVCQGLPGSDTCKTVWAVNAVALNSSTYDSGDVTASVIATATVESLPSSSPSTIDAAPIASTPVLPPSEEVADAFETDADDVDDIEDGDDDDDDNEDDIADSSLLKRSVIKRDLVPTFDESGVFIGILIEDNRLAKGSVLASPTCIASLQIPLQALQNSQRVDVTFVSYQLWVFGMSFVAILNESVPHVVASFLTHVVATLWSVYQVYHTDKHRASFKRLVVQGPCKGNILPDYWSERDYPEIAILSLNAFVTIVIAFLTYKLLKAFGWQTFKKIGASFAINRCYRLVLAFSIAIQLAVFFVGANIALWLDQLSTGIVAPYAEHKMLYLAVYITALICLIPWLAIGWFAVRRESRVWMAIFLVMAVLMITGWASMFASRTFLWTFRIWDFFAFMTVAAAVLLAAAISLGVACRLNFGQGLPEYLVREELGEEPAWEPAMEKTYGDEEKIVQFPSETSSHPVPTFSDAFVGPEGMDRLRAMSRPAARSGPGIGMHARGTSTSGSVDFGSAGFTDIPARPNAALTIARTASNASRSTTRSSLTFDSPTGQPIMNPTDPRLNLARINTADSQRSYSSQNSGTSAGNRLKGQRWEIDM